MKKLPIAFISAFFGMVLLSAPVLAASSTSALEAQIQALMAEIQQLQAQLQQQGGSSSASAVGGSGTVAACNFTRDLGVGSQGNDVSCLQQYLNVEGYAISNITGYFGLETRNAVAKWQAANGIYPATGFFGNYSREEYAKLAIVPESQGQLNQVNKANRASWIASFGIKGGGEVAVGSPVEFVWTLGGDPSISEISDATINVFDGNNNVVQVLTNVPQTLGDNSFTWTTPSNFSTGIYGYSMSYTDIVSGIGAVTVSKTIPAVSTSDNEALDVIQAQPSTNYNQTVSSAATISTITSPVDVGGTVTITGTNLTPTNSVFIGASMVIGQSSDDNTVLTFTLPSTIPAGTYSVSVGNPIGTSDSVSLMVNGTNSSPSQVPSETNTSSGSVSSSNSVSSSSPSNSASQAPATPSAPYNAGSTAFSSTDSNLTIAWNVVSGAEYYDVTHEGGPALVYDNPSTSYTASNLTPSMPYTVAVRACNNNGCSDWSPYATLTTASWTTTSANYYYYSTTNASCNETSDQYTSVSACETALQQHLPNQTTGICYTTFSSCQQSGGLSASVLQSSQSELSHIASTLESMLNSLR